MGPFWDPARLFDGSPGLWAAWAMSAVAGAALTARTFAGLSRADLRAFHADEEGAVYSFSYVLVFPLYVLLLAVVVQTLLLITRIGVEYAAYAGARAAAVYIPVNGGNADAAEPRVRSAVAAALTPFATYSAANRGGGGSADAAEFHRFYAAYAQGVGLTPVNEPYLTAKYAYAASTAGTRITIAVDPAGRGGRGGSGGLSGLSGEPDGGDVTVTVVHNAPFDIPAVGRLLGFARGPAGNYVLPMTAAATLPVEAYKSRDGAPGIPAVRPRRPRAAASAAARRCRRRSCGCTPTAPG